MVLGSAVALWRVSPRSWAFLPRALISSARCVFVNDVRGPSRTGLSEGSRSLVTNRVCYLVYAGREVWRGAETLLFWGTPHRPWLSLQKPQLVTGGESFSRFLQDHCPVVTETYYPTVWCWESRGQTLLRPFITAKPPVQYRK